MSQLRLLLNTQSDFICSDGQSTILVEISVANKAIAMSLFTEPIDVLLSIEGEGSIVSVGKVPINEFCQSLAIKISVQHDLKEIIYIRATKKEGIIRVVAKSGTIEQSIKIESTLSGIPNDLLNLLKKINWDPDQCAIEPKSIGGTNITYFCKYINKNYAFRIASSNSNILSINRIAELAAMQSIATFGISPVIVFFDEQTGDMVTERINGRPTTDEDLNNTDLLKQLIRIMKLLHQQKIEYDFLPTSDIEKRIAFLKDKKFVFPNSFGEAYKLYKNVVDNNNFEEHSDFGLCHNDAFAVNFFFDENKLYLLDYEYAGNGSIYYDLACVSGLWDYNRRKEFLTLYFGYYDDSVMFKVKKYTIIQLMWNTTWAFMKSCDSTASNVDYIGYGNEQLDILNHQTIEKGGVYARIY